MNNETSLAATGRVDRSVRPCIALDPQCPCQDGNACHYEDAPDGGAGFALPVPVNIVDEQALEKIAEPFRREIIAEAIRFDRGVVRDNEDLYYQRHSALQSVVERLLRSSGMTTADARRAKDKILGPSMAYNAWPNVDVTGAEPASSAERPC